MIYLSSPWGQGRLQRRTMIEAIGGKDGGLQVVEEKWV